MLGLCLGAIEAKCICTVHFRAGMQELKRHRRKTAVPSSFSLTVRLAQSSKSSSTASTMAHVFESIAEQPVAWGESDIDEMLAEYLLDDVAEEAGATLPYNE